MAEDACHAAVKTTGEVRYHGTAAPIALHIASIALHAAATAPLTAPVALHTALCSSCCTYCPWYCPDSAPIALHNTPIALHDAPIALRDAINALPYAYIASHAASIALRAVKSTARFVCGNDITCCTDRQCSLHWRYRPCLWLCIQWLSSLIEARQAGALANGKEAKRRRVT